MTTKTGKPLTYYLDTSVWNQLVHNPKPGRPECIARLKRARDEGQAQTYVTRHLLQELMCAFKGNPALGQQLMKTVQEIVLRACLVKDTPDLTAQDVRHLVDPSKDRDFLEPRDSKNALKLAFTIDRLADGLYDQEAKDNCELQYDKQRCKKAEWLCAWWRFVKAERAKFDPTKTIPEKFEDFLGDNSGGQAMLSMVTMWTPKDLKALLPLDELARRVEETTSFRGMMYQLTSHYFHKILKKDKLDGGDAFDAHHAVAAANFDVFVCRDYNARKYAAPWRRNAQRILTLEEFIKVLG